VRTSSIVALIGLCLLAAGCARPRRTFNWMVAGGAEVAPVIAAGEEGTDAQTVGGVHLTGQVAETADDWVTARGRVDLGIGGNGNDPAGHLTVDAQIGLALFDGADHLFGRAGLFGALEGDPVTGLYLLELPTLWLGYQHHGRDADDPWHLDVGPRLSLGVAGRALAPGEVSDLVAAPSVGGAVLLMGQLVTLEVTYAHYFDDAPMDVVRGSACLAAVVAVCLDTRHVIAPFADRWSSTAYWGIRFGVGFATGTDPPL